MIIDVTKRHIETGDVTVRDDHPLSLAVTEQCLPKMECRLVRDQVECWDPAYVVDEPIAVYVLTDELLDWAYGGNWGYAGMEPVQVKLEMVDEGPYAIRGTASINHEPVQTVTQFLE